MKSMFMGIVCSHLALFAHAQTDALQLPSSGKYATAIDAKLNDYSRKITTSSGKAIANFQKQEQKILNQLSRIDTALAKSLSANANKLSELKSRLTDKSNKAMRLAGNAYSGYLDSLDSSLEFLKLLNSKTPLENQKLEACLDNLRGLQGQLVVTEKIKEYFRQRVQLYKQLSEQFPALTLKVRNLHKEYYYYGQRLKEYKSILHDRKKAEAVALKLLHKMPAFRKFIEQHSYLASLFPVSNGLAQASTAGLQTNTVVNNLIEQRIASAGVDPSQYLTQQLQQAKDQLDKLKEQFPMLDNTAEMPGFKPKALKAKPFLKRFELGSNLQFAKSTNFLPARADFAFQVAYRFSEKGSAGGGVDYKLGLGRGIQNLQFSSEGVGLRTFVDYQLKNTFYINGGLEKIYFQSFQDISAAIDDISGWKTSILAGISKKYQISKKLKGNILLLYDFMHNRNLPRTEPIKLRIGYNF